MAVLSRPPAGHVRAAGEAVAIVDLDGGGPRGRSGSGRTSIALGLATVVLVGAFVVAMRPGPAAPHATPIGTVDAAVTASPPSVPMAAAVTAGPLLLAPARTLSLPPGLGDVDLSAIPDSLLNDPPAARLRLPVSVRGTLGIASVGAPAEVAWTEAGYWYWLRARDLSVPQLVDLASALR